MIHAFKYLGITKTVLTDNMKSVVTKRNCEGRPIWNHNYEVFMKVVGFETRLCKPYHPFTKGKVERLVQFVKGNFLAGTGKTHLAMAFGYECCKKMMKAYFIKMTELNDMFTEAREYEKTESLQAL